MSRKDYIKLAALLADASKHNAVNEDFAQGWHAAISVITSRLADILTHENARFDRKRFIAAASKVQS